MLDNKICMQWCRVKDHTCVRAPNFRYDSKHQTMTHIEIIKDRPSKHQSYRRSYVASLVTRGNIYHKGLGMINCPLSGSTEVQHTINCGATVWTMYTFIYPIRNILRLSEVKKGTRGWTMNWYRNIIFYPLATQGRGYPWLSVCHNLWFFSSKSRI